MKNTGQKANTSTKKPENSGATTNDSPTHKNLITHQTLPKPETMQTLTTPPPIQQFPKIPRLNRDCVVTEKIDGTNALIHITETGEIHAGSKNRWITPEDDNHGFAAWVKKHETQLQTLGPGWHRGEWYGAGINKNRYGITDKRFVLFNYKWELDPEMAARKPDCCEVVPILYLGPFNTEHINVILEHARITGSTHHPGNPSEGICVFIPSSNLGFKATIENDDTGKWANQ